MSCRGSPSLAPKLRLSNTNAPRPPAANTSANRSRYISLTAEKPCARTTVGTRPVAASGRYSHPRNVTPSSVLNAISLRIVRPPRHTGGGQLLTPEVMPTSLAPGRPRAGAAATYATTGGNSPDPMHLAAGCADLAPAGPVDKEIQQALNRWMATRDESAGRSIWPRLLRRAPPGPWQSTPDSSRTRAPCPARAP